MRAMKVLFVGIATLAVACGGTKPQPAGPEPGEGHVETGGGEEGGEDGVGPGGGPAAGPDAGVGARLQPPAPLPDAGPPPSPYTFAIENASASSELVFALDKGWQTALFAYTG